MVETPGSTQMIRIESIQKEYQQAEPTLKIEILLQQTERFPVKQIQIQSVIKKM